MLIRVELAKQRDEEKELIMKTETKDMRLFHKLVRNNRKKEIMSLWNSMSMEYNMRENKI